jgi:uncharacterized membrane protein
MEARAKFLGHPIHQMLIVFPLGLLATSFFFDLAFFAFDKSELATTAWWMILAGVLGGLLAAVFGLIDWLAIPPDTRAKAIGMWHGGGNVAVVGLFAASWFLRRPSPATPPMAAVALSGIAVAIALVTGWLGGELVDRLGVGVDDGANLNAPSSLRGKV